MCFLRVWALESGAGMLSPIKSDATTRVRVAQMHVATHIARMGFWVVNWCGNKTRLEVEKLLAESAFVVLFCLLGFSSSVFFTEVGCLPGIDLSLGVVAGG